MNHDWFALFPVAALVLVVALGVSTRVAFRVLALLVLVLGAIAVLQSGTSRFAELAAHAIGGACTLALLPWLQSSANRSRWLQLAGVLALLQGLTVLVFAVLFTGFEPRPGMWRSAFLLGGSTLATLAVLCGLAPRIERRLGWKTRALWTDLSQPYGSPLVAELQAREPAVFQQSRLASEIAAAAGAAVGADLSTVRAAAMHADVGRLARARNSGLAGAAQSPSLELSPELECRVEFDHVKDSVSICQEHDLPETLAEIVGQHHGTLLRRDALFAAAKLRGLDVGEISLEPFRYPGPRPSSRESAAVQAGWFLAEKAASEEAAEELQSAVSEGEWANSGLSESERSLLLRAATQASVALRRRHHVSVGVGE